ncbi:MULTISPECIES: hypothetical protein [Flavobacterium]|uniref:Lipoprotein n=2 Tax=Flavobacterium TaxID=237 RepID=A0A437U8C2_9FLAO|nr:MULTISPECIES: hypothetical protein [Flavobacterium]OWP85041.1 hypothetical protein BWK59_02035 [Flavobacterium davisii]QYS88305.1 hypothetical protein JJC05_11180 [Flavobacterium davisii]RVU89811.1 hypothetical protein EH230_13665 [Flavobacterium columnare]SPE77718.1 hypothetical protein FLACOL_01723 [Flavobacterium columnare]
MKKIILFLSVLLIIGCNADYKLDKKPKEFNKLLNSKEISSMNDSNEEDVNVVYSIPSEKSKFPIIIDQEVYNELGDSLYTPIKDINTINSLLIPKYKQEIISINDNTHLFSNYSFVKIAERKIKNFKITFFSSRYHGNKSFTTTFVNVTKENSSKIIDSKKVGYYYSYPGESKLVTLVMDKNGKIEITTMIDRDKPTRENLKINMDGKIVASR